jgi:2,4-dienoyl-CoA reductase-like NADH-dependent reductase (Old Yellow Enzyme family)
LHFGPEAGVPELSDPIQIKSMQLHNRLVMAPIVTGFAIDNQVTDAHIKWYSKRAGAGPSLVIVEASGVSPDGLILSNQIGLWDDKFLPGLARLADSIHSSGAKAIIQLVHAGGR